MGDFFYSPLIEDMTWSYSRIKSFNDCPYRWYMTYIRNLKDAPQFYTTYGSFMHKLIAGILSGELTKDQAQLKFLIGFSDEVQGQLPAESTVLKYIRSGSSYLESFQTPPYKTIGVEKKIDFQINGNKFVAFLDYIGEDNGLDIVDHKSRDLKQRSKRSKPTRKDEELDEMLRQLYIYAEAVKQEYGEYPKHLCFNCFRTGTFIKEPFNKEAHKEAIDWATNSIEAIKDTDDFHPNLEYFACRYICGLNDECCYYKMG